MAAVAGPGVEPVWPDDTPPPDFVNAGFPEFLFR
jgi:hypothetical protein